MKRTDAVEAEQWVTNVNAEFSTVFMSAPPAGITASVTFATRKYGLHQGIIIIIQ